MDIQLDTFKVAHDEPVKDRHGWSEGAVLKTQHICYKR